MTGLIAGSIFIWVWMSTFLSNCVAYIASVGASTYYWNSDAQKEGEAEIM